VFMYGEILKAGESQTQTDFGVAADWAFRRRAAEGSAAKPTMTIIFMVYMSRSRVALAGCGELIRIGFCARS
jgi:hypothetical protein